jgi:pimeloyl-ACP methyl ester carboxylesterase
MMRRPDRFVPTIDGTQLAVYLDGDPDADRTVVLVHGWSTSARAWTDLALSLARPGTRVLRYDQRGHGATAFGTSPMTVPLLADDLARVIEATGAQRGHVVLYGHSMGGFVVMGLAARRPEWFAPTGPVAAVVLSSTCARTLPGRDRPARSPLALARYAASRLVDHIVARARAALVAAIALSVGRTPPARVTAFWSTLTSHDQSAALATLAQVRVHVLAGTKDRIIPLYAVRDMVAQIPGARLHLAHGVGHTLPRVHLQAVSRLLSLLLRYKPRPVAHV